jgi:hypothetical protein
MIKGKKITVLICGMLMFGCFAGSVKAQDLETDIVTGNTYSCFFFTPFDIFSANIIFSEDGTLTISRFAGRGRYLSLTDGFAGFYFALDANIGDRSGDIILTIAGATFDPFIIGTGTILIDFQTLAAFVFQGRVIPPPGT